MSFQKLKSFLVLNKFDMRTGEFPRFIFFDRHIVSYSIWATHKLVQIELLKNGGDIIEFKSG
ncbi:hypothetical protein NCCP133_04970 [Cytobacillus sp. NCCP-133]|nr:hypothetical protein NCCP133_04970 [Cytobacillus sp. NCCP-133]